MGKITHSWSRIQAYETCPFMYMKQYVDKQVTEVNALMVVGRVVHNAVNLYNKHCIKNKVEHDFEKWKEFAYKALEQESLESEYYEEVLTMVKSYAESHTVPLDSVVGAEEEVAINRKFEVVEWNAEDVWFRGIIDLLQMMGDRAKITDYKSGWLMESPKLQLEIYAWLIKKIYPHISYFEIELDFVRHEYQSDFSIEEEQLEDIEKKILSKTTKIENDVEFKPKVGIACSYCGCWRWCPAMKETDIGFKMPETEEEAVKLALALERSSKLKEEAQKILKKWCDAKGALVAGGRQFGFNVSGSYEFESVEQFLVEAEEAGVDLFDTLTVNNSKLKVRMREDVVKKLVERIGKKKVSVTFSAKKYKPSDDLTPKEVESREAEPKEEQGGTA